jgi:hypothetical protein
MNNKGWIAVDLDGTLAEYHGWVNTFNIGAPIPLMQERVKKWLAEGRDVRIFTARVDGGLVAKTIYPEIPEATVEFYKQVDLIVDMIQNWTEKHLGKRLPVTNKKDAGMIELWDDQCVQVIKNTGQRVDEL